MEYIYLFIVSLIDNIDHSLGISISSVTDVRGAIVNHCFVDGICSFVRENASGETRDKLLDLEIFAQMHDDVVHHDILTIEFHRIIHIGK